MHRTALFVLLLAPVALPAQETIKVETTDVMQVCGRQQPDPAKPCATAPRATHKIDPEYSDKARKHQREGVVQLAVVVDASGKPRDIRVVQSVGDGLDEQAIKAVKSWTFEPGTYQGHPVSAEVMIEISFKLFHPGSTDSPARSSSEFTEQIRNLITNAQEAYSRHDYQAAVILTRRIISLSPHYSVAYNVLGLSLLEMHELAEAATALETCIQYDPASSFAYNNLARVYWRQRRYDEAQAQFQKQIALNPDDHYAHANLGAMLRDQKKCAAAIPELEKALTLTPNNSNALVALGECYIDEGDKAKGLSKLEQAASEASTSTIWNTAAYALAKRNLELERAEKWSQTAIQMESPQLQSISLEHLSPAHFGRVILLASEWDTLGWIYFRQGKFDQAAEWTEAAWSIRQSPVFADHLAQIYESQHKTEEATRMYALAIAAGEAPVLVPPSPDQAEGLEDARKKLMGSQGNEKAVTKLVDRARVELLAAREVAVPNTTKAGGSADFTLSVIAGGKASQAHKVSGEATFAPFAEALPSINMPVKFPVGVTVELPRRGTLTCSGNEPNCQLVLLTADDAFDIARKQTTTDASTLAGGAPDEPHTYNNPALGIKVSLPEQWQLLREEPGSFTRPHTAMLGKPGAIAYMVLTRERMEGSSELYSKMLEAGFSQREEYHRNGSMEVKRDGIPGSRWNIAWKDKDINYTAIVEFFSVGDDHYRAMAMAPSEVYGRYAENFEEMLRSMRFPLLHTDPKLLEKP